MDELSHGLANLSMFPYFDMAHYIVSVMALREQPGMFLISDALKHEASLKESHPTATQPLQRQTRARAIKKHHL